MAARRRIPIADGDAAMRRWRDDPQTCPAAVVATAVRYTLEELTARAPGRSVEVRVPPYGATQCLPGPRHTRGTPSAVVETDPVTWLRLATGELAWAHALAQAAVQASGQRAELGPLLPLTCDDPAIEESKESIPQ